MTKHKMLVRRNNTLPTNKGINLIKSAVKVTKVDIKQDNYFLYPITDFIERQIPTAKDRMNVRLDSTKEIMNAIDYLKKIGEL